MTEPSPAPDGAPDDAPDDARRRRAFHHLLADTLGVSVTHFTVWFAVTFFVYLETRSVFATGVISGIYLTLTALSGLWFGSLVDHHRKKSVMAASTVVSFVLYGAALGIYLAAGRDAFADPASVTLVAQFWAIPFMTTGAGADLIGGWFGTGPERGLALVFTLTGLLGVVLTLFALRSRHYRLLAGRYQQAPAAQPA